MPFYKLNMFFSLGKQGWSDTYYVEGVDANDAYNGALPVMNLRQGLLCNPATVEAVRLSDEAIYRDASLFDVPGGFNFPHAQDADVPWNAWLFRLEALAKYWRQLYIRGIPDAVWELSPDVTQTNIANTWLSDLSNFGNKITAASSRFRIKVIDKDVTGGPKPLLDAIAGAAGKTVWDVGLLNGLAIGDSVSFLNTGLSPAPGKQVVRAINAPNLVETSYRPRNNDYTGLKQNAKWRKNVVLYIKPDFYNKRGIVHRIVGRPFGLQRGRRPA